ncbi:hypothetical protein B1748_23700 [Paenibacillus sp. MY03]|nr:hypothetical protein B1748_23700 [Paenibacillus sp. MY03]
MDLSKQPAYSVPKPNFKRGKPTAKQRGAIPDKVRKEVDARSGECCERCGKHKNAVWTLEKAHVTRRWRSESKCTAYDIVNLCGPSSDSSTCHHWADYTRAGREWLQQFKLTLEESA